MDEIEKKYRVCEEPAHLEDYAKSELEQGYLSVNPVVRIRRDGDVYLLTYKQRKGQEEKLRVNTEIELPLTKESYEHMKAKADGRLITKTRYKIPIEGDLLAELDIFHGFYEGLKVVEVEFPTVEVAREFVPPDWFGEDVSGDHRYSNSSLSTEQLRFWEEPQDGT